MKLLAQNDDRVHDIVDEIEGSLHKTAHGYYFQFAGLWDGYFTKGGLLRYVKNLCNWRLSILDPPAQDHYEVKHDQLVLNNGLEPLFDWEWRDWKRVRRIQIDAIGISFWTDHSLHGCHWPVVQEGVYKP